MDTAVKERQSLGDMDPREREETLRRLAAQGLSTGQVAEMFWTTRNSVLGYAHRAKPKIIFHSQQRRGSARTPPPVKAQKQPIIQRNLPREKRPAPSMPATSIKLEPLGTFMTATERGKCHWPMFDEIQRVTMMPSQLPFCARDTPSKDQRYCEAHQRVMFTSAKVE